MNQEELPKGILGKVTDTVTIRKLVISLQENVGWMSMEH